MSAGSGFDLRRLLSPASVAVAGASPDPKSVGGAILRNLAASGFKGELTLVSPRRDEIDGRPCVKSLLDIPLGTDTVILNIPRVAVREAVEACAARQAGGVVVFAAGFGEAGDEGRAEQEEIAALCRKRKIALLGPNCLGFTNYVDGVSASFEGLSFDNVKTDGARLAVIAQSGATAASMRDAFMARGFAVSHVVATGNEAVLHAEDFIDYGIDEGVAAIAAYVEQVRNPARFLAVARRGREKGVPIVMLHPGRSARAREAAQSHTGALAGDYAVMKAGVENEAVVLVETMDELFDAVAVLQRFPRPQAGDTAIITNSGAIRGLSLDLAEDARLPLARPSAQTLEALKALAPEGMDIDIPLDLGIAGYADAGVFTKTTQAVFADETTGAALWAMVGGGPHQQRAKAEAMAAIIHDTDKPLALAITGDESALDAGLVSLVRENGIPFFRSLDRSVRAMAAVHRYGRARRNAETRRPMPGQTPSLAGAGTIAEHEGKTWLRALGVPTPRGAVVASVEAAVRQAREIGYPLVVKAHSAAIAHKSDVGGVIVGVKNDDELRAAWDRLHANISKAAPDAVLDGVLVEAMAGPGLEMIVGAKRDPEWGPVVLVGLGGVWTEALDAVEIMPPDIAAEEAVARIRAMKGAKLLGAFRGQPARDVEALARIVLALGDAMRADPSILEVDINPVRVFAEGEGAMALDALIVKES